MTTTTAATWEAVIGLEVHVELATATKLFCGCRNEFGAEPNTNICPVCLGLPGSLPVLNEKAVEFALQIAEALNLTVPEHSIFHRKNYFYPDMPKDFQTSQYDEPITIDGSLEIDGVVIGIERAHMEEDTGKTVHVGGGGRIHEADHSLVDYNRAGVPLMEIVSRPDIRTAEQARAYAGELRAILQTIGVSDVKMEEGSMRIDANVSLRPVGADAFGTKVEVKNMNSLRSLGRALEHEIERQTELLESGGRVVQETLNFDPGTAQLRSLRSKEEAHDYRYFPEPDLVPLEPSPELVDRLRDGLPELPAARMARFREQYSLPQQYATDLNAETSVADYFERVAAGSGDAKAAADWVLNNPGSVGAIPADSLAGLIGLIANGTITSTIAKQVYARLEADPTADPAAIVEGEGLASIGDSSELEAMVVEVIAANPQFVEQFRGGKEGVINALVGQVMKRTQGRADARQVQELFRSKLS